ncbi:hypothetical protein HYU12_04570 [Candidatus Woesearchaeota archaeon]|nr:hypothetical protein [Candidatus Woesearchaeota archaeon]
MFSKKGKLYFKAVIAAALLITLASAIYTLAANPSASTSNTRSITANAPIAHEKGDAA